MVDSILDNLSLRTQRRADLKLEIGLTTSATLTEQFIKEIEKILTREEIESFNVHLSDITHTAVIIVSDYYTAPVTIAEFNLVKQEVNLQSLKLMEELKIEIAGASSDIRLQKQA